MIFYLTDSLRGDSEYLESIRHELHNLAFAAIEGYHYLMGDFDILGDCIKLFEHEKEVCGLFKNLYDNWYSMPVPKCVSYYMEVVKDNPSMRSEDGKTIAQRPITSFGKMSSVMPCQLVCENDKDCEFYKYVGSWYVRNNKINNASIGFETDGSGGCEEAKNKVSKHLLKNQFCLCILDSDISFEGDKVNAKSLECQNAYKNRDDCNCIILEVRELENLLPLNYVDEVTANHHDYQQPLSKDYVRHFNYLRHSHKHLEILPYFDYKEGIKKTDNYLKSPKYKKFAEICWEQNPEICTGQTFKEYEDSVAVGDRLYLPLGRKIHAHTLAHIVDSKLKGTLTEPDLLPYQETEWNRIGKEIATWGYSRPTEAIS